MHKHYTELEALPYQLCTCGHTDCNPDQEQDMLTIHKHELRAKTLAVRSKCTCGGPTCKPHKLYTHQTIKTHLATAAQLKVQQQQQSMDHDDNFSNDDSPSADSNEVESKHGHQQPSTAVVDQHDDNVSNGDTSRVDNTVTMAEEKSNRVNVPGTNNNAPDSSCRDDTDNDSSDNDDDTDNDSSDNDTEDANDPDQHSGYPQREHPELEDNFDHLEGLQDSDFFDSEADPDTDKDKNTSWETDIGKDMSIIMLVTLLFLWQKRFNVNNTAMRSLFRIIKLIITALGGKQNIPAFDTSKKKFTPDDACKASIRDVCDKCEYLYDEGKGTTADVCPICTETRFKHVGGKTVARKNYFRWNIFEQLKMRLGWKGFTDRLQPVPDKASINGTDIVSSMAITDKVRRNITVHQELGKFVFVLALACDGFNPWRGVLYCMWFLALRILNLDAKLGAKTEELITIGITSGPKEPKTLQYYTQDIVKQLLYLQANDVTIPHVLADGVQSVKGVVAFLISLIGDYPALCKMLHIQGAGTYIYIPFFFFSINV